MRSFGISLLLVLFVLSAAIYSSVGRLGNSFANLDAVHHWVAEQFPNVEHIAPAELARLNSAVGNDIVLFDVRQSDEYAVSHIPGAIQVTPGIDAGKFAERFSAQLKGKTVIFYCSVGYRSSRLADRMNSFIRAEGAKASYNLSGGVFGWHNAKQLLADMHGKATSAIHPYDDGWGRLLDNQDAVRTTP